MLHFTSRHSLVQLTCSLMNSCGDCSSCMRGGTPSRTVRVCKEEPEAMLVRTHAASNWREKVEQVIGELAANNQYVDYQCRKGRQDTAGHGHCTEHLTTIEQKTFEGENFHELAEKTFADCSLSPCQRTPRPKISWRKLSQIATKPQNL